MKILVYDDDPKAVAQLLECLDHFSIYYPCSFTTHVCKNREELFSLIKEYDFLFLDIEVYDENGIDLGLELRKLHPSIHIIITSSFTKYLVSGYKVKADRYFLKPIHQLDFNMEFGAVVKQFQQDHAYVLDDKICNYKLYLKDILYVEFLDRKTYVHVHDQETLITSYPLNYWINTLENNLFTQTYKSILVNVSYVKTYDDQRIILDNQETLPLSRHYKKMFQQTYMNYLQGGF